MARNQAVRKAAKAIRRKAVVAAKRSSEVAANGLGGQVRQAAALPILDCLVSDGLFDCGMGVVTLIRGTSRAYQHMAFFMVDSYCLGVKDVFFRALDWREAEPILDGMQASDPMSPIPPAEARKLLHDVVAWARDNGFLPPRDFDRIVQLFGDVMPAATDYTPRFGKEGKAMYIPGPRESPAQIKRRIQTVRSHWGDAAANQSILSIAALLAEELALRSDEYELAAEEDEPVGSD